MKIRPRAVLIRLLYIPIVLYLSVAIYALFFSDSAIFLPHPSSYRDTPDILKIRSANGNVISALYLPQPSAAFTLLVSHGNAEDLGDDREWLENLRRAGFSVLAYDYQGYGTSQGKPTEKTACEDERAAYEYLTHELKTLPDRIIIFGRSVGSGPAVHLAARQPAAALILQSPFVSAFRVVTRVPLLPFDKFPNYKEIGHVRCPVLIIHGAHDSVIPLWHGEEVFNAANQPKQFVVIPRADHNDLDIVAGPSYPRILQTFTATLSKGGPSLGVSK